MGSTNERNPKGKLTQKTARQSMVSERGRDGSGDWIMVQPADNGGVPRDTAE